MNRCEENLCTHGGDLLAYLYNEMPLTDREQLELHLSDCVTCIDDFAALSQSRYPVYEWKRLEFDSLPTPRVVIQYEETRLSLIDKFRAKFSFNPRFAFAGVAGLLLAGV